MAQFFRLASCLCGWLCCFCTSQLGGPGAAEPDAWVEGVHLQAVDLIQVRFVHQWLHCYL
jgi:hypothetical protein